MKSRKPKPTAGMQTEGPTQSFEDRRAAKIAKQEQIQAAAAVHSGAMTGQPGTDQAHFIQKIYQQQQEAASKALRVLQDINGILNNLRAVFEADVMNIYGALDASLRLAHFKNSLALICDLERTASRVEDMLPAALVNALYEQKRTPAPVPEPELPPGNMDVSLCGGEQTDTIEGGVYGAPQLEGSEDGSTTSEGVAGDAPDRAA